MNSLNLGHMLGCGLNGAKESFDAGNNKTGYLKCMPVIGGIVSLIIRAFEGKSVVPTWEGRCLNPFTKNDDAVSPIFNQIVLQTNLTSPPAEETTEQLANLATARKSKSVDDLLALLG